MNPPTLDRLAAAEVLSPFELELGRLVDRLHGTPDSPAALAAALAAHRHARGHVYLDLAAASQIPFEHGRGTRHYQRLPGLPGPEAWTAELAASPAVTEGAPADRPADCSPDRLPDRPLVLDRQHHRLYLARAWHCQQQLASLLADRLAAPPTAPPTAPAKTAGTELRAHLEHLFAGGEAARDADQRLAVASAVDRAFQLITGGPGTGKTYTIARLLALQALIDPDLTVRIAAPTGKAAHRLNESLGAAFAAMSRQHEIALPPAVTGARALTLHRLLRWTPRPPERGGPFEHGPDHPVQADLVVVDEASMIDLELAWHLLRALGPSTRLVLVGDADQLASVEAGGVLADLSHAITRHGRASWSAARRQTLAARTGLPPDPDPGEAGDPLRDHLVPLRHSHRFGAGTPLGRLAATVRAGDAGEVIRQLTAPPAGAPVHLAWHPHTGQAPGAIRAEIVAWAAEAYRPMLETLGAGGSDSGALQDRRLLDALAAVRVLSAHRAGPLGEEALNTEIARALATAGLLDPGPGHLGVGCPVIVRANDYRQRLFNGDVGLCVPAADRTGRIEVLFEGTGEEEAPPVRRIPAGLLPAHQPGYAMTIHKAQGSQFSKLAVVLPADPSPVTTRELLYTAITRLVEGATSTPAELRIDAKEEVLAAAIETPVRRDSGLRDALGHRSPGDRPHPESS